MKPDFKGVVNFNCSSLVVNVQGIVFGMDTKQLDNAAALVFRDENGKEVRFLNSNKIKLVLKCPICGEEAVPLNGSTVMLRCSCFKQDGVIQVEWRG